MSKRLIKTLSSENGNKQAKIYRDSEWQEYIVEFYIDNNKQENASSHTDDKEDAFSTANHFVSSL